MSSEGAGVSIRGYCGINRYSIDEFSSILANASDGPFARPNLFRREQRHENLSVNVAKAEGNGASGEKGTRRAT